MCVCVCGRARVDAPAPPTLQVVLHPSYDGELAGLRVFLSQHRNCSDAGDADIGAVGADGTALLPAAGLRVLSPDEGRRFIDDNDNNDTTTVTTVTT